MQTCQPSGSFSACVCLDAGDGTDALVVTPSDAVAPGDHGFDALVRDGAGTDAPSLDVSQDAGDIGSVVDVVPPDLGADVADAARDVVSLDLPCTAAVATDPNNCGACGYVCPASAHAAARCSAGVCVTECLAGFGNCNGNPADGCETATNTATDCGACGAACTAGMRCASTTCVSACPAGTTFCPATSACANLLSDLANCGSCGQMCPTPAHAAPLCRAGACGFSCLAGYADCDGIAATGCETNLNSDATMCGACDRRCSAAHGNAGCSSGACVVTSCELGYADCNGTFADGCESQLLLDPAHCGACGRACVAPPNAAAVCSAGVCGLGACSPGYADCDGNVGDGCEAALQTDSRNCGACGRTCSAGQVCVTGVCCAPGQTTCGGACVTATTDPTNCGACGRVCTAPPNAVPTCASGVCGFACSPGFGNCDGNADNGCEISFAADPSNCGACGARCVGGTATTPSNYCSGSVCHPTCAAGYGACSDPRQCTDRLDTLTNCGVCGNACPVLPFDTNFSCTAGACAFTCSRSHGDCDLVASNGCETYLVSASHCGACGAACQTNSTTRTNVCMYSSSGLPGYCTPTCVTGYGDCDTNRNNGCETNLANDRNNCGSCGRRCGIGSCFEFRCL